MFRKLMASLVLATFLVGATAAPARAGCRGNCGGAGNTAVISAVVMIVLTVVTLGLVHLFAKSEEEETNREGIRVNAGIAHRTIGPGSVAVVTNNGYARAAVSEDAHDVLLPYEPGGE